MELKGLPLHLLLSLRNKAMTGYDLTKAMKTSYVRRASHQQVYRELSKLNELGLVQFTIEPQDGKPDRKVYSITSDGHAAIDTATEDMAPEVPLLHGIRTVMMEAGNSTYFESLSKQLTEAIKQIKTNLIAMDCPIEQLAMNREISIHTAELSYCADVIEHFAENAHDKAA